MRAVPAQGPRYITLADAAALISTPPETIRYWIWQGKLRAYRPGRALLLREDELRAHVEASSTVAVRARKARGGR